MVDGTYGMAYKRHVCCMQICEYVKKIVLEMGFIWVWVLYTHTPTCEIVSRAAQSSINWLALVQFAAYLVKDPCVCVEDCPAEDAGDCPDDAGDVCMCAGQYVKCECM
jgi:hypothetical protein